MENKEKGFMEIINLEIDPTVINQNVRQWAPNGIVRFGENNDQFDKYIDLYLGSTTNNAIINGASDLIYANGLNFDIIDKNELRKIVKDFYMFGNAVIQIVDGEYFHIPTNFIRAEEVDEKGRINNYYFSTDWFDASIEPKVIPNWEYDKKSKISLFYLRPYTPKSFYYNIPSYIGCQEYCQLEIELGTYLINTVQSSFSGTKIVNFNNGQSDTKRMKELSRDLKNKLSGPKGDKIIVSFNKNKDNALTVEDLSLDNASEQYRYLSEECEKKIIVGHKVTSPLLLGIRDSSGFSSNSDEMIQAVKIYNKNVIKPNQDFIADTFKLLTGNNEIGFVNTEEKELSEEELMEQERIEFEDSLNIHLKGFISLGVDDIEGYSLIETAPVHFKDDKYTKLSIIDNFIELVGTGRAHADSKSKQDSEDIIIRYRYKGDKNPERKFCKAMMKADKLYRIEDIKGMENLPVNPGFGLNGSDTYDILLYSGGGRISDNFPQGTCKHKWQREIYLRDGKKIDPNKLTKISTSEARRRGYSVPTNDSRISIAPHNRR